MIIILVFIRCPPYSVLGILIHNDELIFRRTTCVNTCHNIDSAKVTFLTLFIAFKARIHFFLVQIFIRRIMHNFCSSSNTILC